VTLVLASASPRRRELLARLGIPFVVRPSDVDEEIGPSANPAIVAGTLARTKAEAARLVDGNATIIAADTVVVCGGSFLGKPAGPEEAREMLRRLRGETHQVLTAIVVMPAGRRSGLARYPTTIVRMRSYSGADIEASISRGDPFDKAGGYAIQDEVLRPVASYEGCYCNVVGLSLWTAIELLAKAGVGMSPMGVGQLLPQCAECPLRPSS
jgi:MAF protein